jgi:pimeloyl-ACP methyl ester carboxylesterase
MVSTPTGWVEVAHTGDGPPVVFVHGTPGTWRVCVPIAEDLASSFRVVLLSRPGYGRTPLRVGRTYEDQADVYANMLDSLGIERAAIVAVSGGGPSAAAFATKHADRTTALVLLCAVVPHMLDVPSSTRVAARVPAVPQLVAPVVRALGRRRLTNPERVRVELQKSLTPDEYERADADDSIIADALRHAIGHVEAPPGLSGMRNDLRQFDRAKREGPPELGVAAPTLVLHGDADPVVGPDQARWYASAIAGARLEIFEGSGHLIFVTRRTDVSRAIRGFLMETLTA